MHGSITHRLTYCLLLSTCVVLASSYERWNLVSVPVYTQERSELVQVARIGAYKALARLTGTEQLPSALPELRNPLNLVQEYGYVESPTAGLHPWFNAPVQDVRFLYSEEAFESLGQKLSLPLLPQQRPQVALWVAYANSQTPLRLVTSVDLVEEPDILYLVHKMAKSAWPLLHLPGLEDTPWRGAVARLDWHTLTDLGTQRGYDETWVVHLSESPSGWHGRWVQPTPAGVHYGQQQGGSLREVLDGVLRAMMQTALGAYQYHSGPLQSYTVTMQQINNKIDYQRALQHLRTMSGVEAVAPTALGINETRFRVDARTPYERLSRDLNKNQQYPDAVITKWGEP